MKGGLGCLLIFAVTAVVILIAGGEAHADVGGILFIFVIGGIVGLLILSIYKRGWRAAQRTRSDR